MSNDSKYDLNQDSLINSNDRGTWVNVLKKTYFGDSNLDGEFNSADFVFVFTSGKYETGQSAGWGAGDWSGDGLFDSNDFVQAFTDGGYELGPRATVAAVPEPTAVILLMLGSMTAAIGYRNRFQRAAEPPDSSF